MAGGGRPRRGRASGSAPSIGCTEFPATASQTTVSKQLWIADADVGDLDIPGDLTIEFWVKMLQNYSGVHYFIDKSDLGTPNFVISKEGSNHGLHFRAELTGGTAILENYSLPLFDEEWLNSWRHIAVTRKASDGEVSFYTDGELRSAESGPAGNLTTAGASHNLSVGAREHNGQFNCASRMAELRIWNVLRTPEEIAANYSEQLGGVGAGLMLNAPLALDWNDTTANENHLVLREPGSSTIEPVLVEDDGPWVAQ